MNNEENKKSVDNFNADSVDGANVKGGFGGMGPMDPGLHPGGDLPPDLNPGGPIEGDPMNPPHDPGTGVGPMDPGAGGGPIDPSADFGPIMP